MTTLHRDDATGKTYTTDELMKTVAIADGGVFENFDYHRDETDYEEVRTKLHVLVDEFVDAEKEAFQPTPEE